MGWYSMNGLRVLLLQQQRPKYDLGVRFIIFSLVGGILLAGGRWEGWWRLATRLHFYFWSICMQFPLFSLLIIFHFTPLDPFGLVFFFSVFSICCCHFDCSFCQLQSKIFHFGMALEVVNPNEEVVLDCFSDFLECDPLFLL